MITAGVFTVIGLSFMALQLWNKEAIIPAVWTEFAGDGVQSIVSAIVDNLRGKYHDAKLAKKMNEISPQDMEKYKLICNEVREAEEDNKKKWQDQSKIRNAFEKIKDKILPDSKKKDKFDIKDVRTIVAISECVLWELDYKEYIEACSPTFMNLPESEKNSFALFINTVVDIYRKRIFSKTDDEKRVTASIIVSSLKFYIERIREDVDERFDGIEDDLADKVAAKLALACGDDGANIQRVALARFSPKYILNSCPECGYAGPRIYSNESTGMTTCAACGRSYSLVKYCRPDICEEINAKLNVMKSDNGKFREQLVSMYGQQSQKTDYILSVLEKVKNNGIVTNTMLDIMSDGLENVATKQLLDECMKDVVQATADVGDIVERSFKEYFEGLSEIKGSTQEISQAMKDMAEQNKEYNAFTLKCFDSLGGQIADIYNYASESFGKLCSDNALIMQYVSRACSKEYLESMSDSLGLDIKHAIRLEGEKITALNMSSVAQIIGAIDRLKDEIAPSESKKASSDSDEDRRQFEWLLRNESSQLSGQIRGLHAVLRSSDENNRRAFRAIIDSQEEIKSILLAKVGLNITRQQAESMYRGRIPSRYLYNEGFGGPFACPYCGVVEDRRMNEEQYCRCSVCGQKFLAIDPFNVKGRFDERDIWQAIEENCGRDVSDPLLATPERVEAWRAAHRAQRSQNNEIKMKSSDGILLMPELPIGNIEKLYFGAKVRSSVETLIFPVGYKDIPAGLHLESLVCLKSIVFMGKNGKSDIDPTNLSGKNGQRPLTQCLRRDIIVYGNDCYGKPIKLVRD